MADSPEAPLTSDDETRMVGPETLIATARSVFKPPEQIGPYRIARLLGEGGMGAVYLAEQSEPIRRSVALKLIKLGMDTHEVVVRFEADVPTLLTVTFRSSAPVDFI